MPNPPGTPATLPPKSWSFSPLPRDTRLCKQVREDLYSSRVKYSNISDLSVSLTLCDLPSPKEKKFTHINVLSGWNRELCSACPAEGATLRYLSSAENYPLKSPAQHRHSRNSHATYRPKNSRILGSQAGFWAEFRENWRGHCRCGSPSSVKISTASDRLPQRGESFFQAARDPVSESSVRAAEASPPFSSGLRTLSAPACK